MKIITWLLTVLLVVVISAGCTGEGRIVGELTPQTTGDGSDISEPIPQTTGDISKPTPQTADDGSDITEPTPNIPDETLPIDKNEAQFMFRIEGRTIGFDFDMQMDDAQAVLDDAGFKYHIANDASTIRSWTGWCLQMKGLWLVFDADKRLHEIHLGLPYETNIPIKIGDMVTDMMKTQGEAEWFDCPEMPSGAVSVLSCEYEMDGYYVRPVFAGERVSSDEYKVWEIYISKYSKEVYEDRSNAATLTLTGVGGESALFYIGMTRQDALDALERLGIGYRESTYGIISGDVILGEGPTFENDAFEGYCFSLYFDWNDRVCTVDASGSGVWTSAGLRAMDWLKGGGDDKEKMLSLYGEDYYERPMSYSDTHYYRYREGDQYVYICTHDFGDGKEAVTGFYVSRYTGVRPFQ